MSPQQPKATPSQDSPRALTSAPHTAGGGLCWQTPVQPHPRARAVPPGRAGSCLGALCPGTGEGWGPFLSLMQTEPLGSEELTTACGQGLGRGGPAVPLILLPSPPSQFPPRPPRPGAGEPSPWAGWAVVPPNPPEPQHHTGAPWAHLSGTQGLRQGGGIAAESPGPSQQPEPGLTQTQQLLRGRKLERRLQPPPLLPPAPPAVVLV